LGATFRRHVPVLTALALLGVGLVAVVTRVDVPSLALRDSGAALDRAANAALPGDPPCHPKAEAR
jgi:hypothetical protein